MTNGRGAGMASFMTKKKKYKFQVDVTLEELLEVPFVSAVLFAKLRLSDGGNFQDYSSREEVRDHRVRWGAKFKFPCKMMANASTGVMERCILRISIRKESKGGRSFNKLGYVDLNLAEYAGAGVTHKKALLEGYDARHRQDNSMLSFSIAMNMLSGDILFKVPSPSLKHKQIIVEDNPNDSRSDEFSNNESLKGSIASGSSGFGSLPKKRAALLSSDLVIGQTLTENNPTLANNVNAENEAVQLRQTQPEYVDEQCVSCEPGHSRNSSNTSQLSKASGYSSIHSHSHSRQSSSGDSGHIRNLQHRSVRLHTITNPAKLSRTYTCPKRFHIPTSLISDDVFSTPKGLISPAINYNKRFNGTINNNNNNEEYFTPTNSFSRQISNVSCSSNDEYRTPEGSFRNEHFNELQKSQSTSVVERLKNILPIDEVDFLRPKSTDSKVAPDIVVIRSKSEFQIPQIKATPIDRSFSQKFDGLISFLTPRPKRRNLTTQSTPNDGTSLFKVPGSPIPSSKNHETRTTSLNSLSAALSGDDGFLSVHPIRRSLPHHRKLLDGSSGGKLAPLAISPDETPSSNVSSDLMQIVPTNRRTSVTTNPSGSSLVLSETGSLDRAKATYERRKKTQSQDDGSTSTPAAGRVETTRVNPDDLIEEIIKSTNFEQQDDSAETSGLQLFIAKDGTAALGNHEVKSQMFTGAQGFKQVVMEDR